jgi:dihydroorotate dehydrogenase electron transfer subunit
MQRRVNPVGMHETRCTVQHVREVAENIFVLRCTAPDISRSVSAGQFVNVRVAEGTDPLLRRPFSVHRTDGDAIELIFNVIGRGTSCLRQKTPGSTVDLIGPLGVPFSLGDGGFSTGVLIGGGLGVAPLPIATAALRAAGKKVVTFLGARTASQLVTEHLADVHIATDDGSKGYHGTVVDLARREFAEHPWTAPRLFACGPTPMLRAVAQFALQADLQCQVSLEGPMGCGIGICQGCPVELVGDEKAYALMCKDGPTFDVRKVRF